MSENGADAVGDSLRENMQMEKLKALRPMNIELGPQQARKPAAGRTDTKEVAKEIQDEVDDRVRDTEREKSKGPHCDALVEQIKASAAEEKTKSEFSPTTSSTPIEVDPRPSQRASPEGTITSFSHQDPGCTSNVECAPGAEPARCIQSRAAGEGRVIRAVAGLGGARMSVGEWLSAWGAWGLRVQALALRVGGWRADTVGWHLGRSSSRCT